MAESRRGLHPRRAEACELAQRAVALVPGLRGYVGVDLVLGEETCWLIEINPRVTTSYVGLRRVVGLNMAAAIWRACRDGSLPAWRPFRLPLPSEGGGSMTRESLVTVGWDVGGVQVKAARVESCPGASRGCAPRCVRSRCGAAASASPPFSWRWLRSWRSTRALRSR